MGNGVSGDIEYDPMYGGYNGYPRPGQNPRSRGPRNFEELDQYPPMRGGKATLIFLITSLWLLYLSGINFIPVFRHE